MQYVLTKEELEEFQKTKEALIVDLKKELLCKYDEKVRRFEESLRMRVRGVLQCYRLSENTYSPYDNLPITAEEFRVLLQAIIEDASKIVL